MPAVSEAVSRNLSDALTRRATGDAARGVSRGAADALGADRLARQALTDTKPSALLSGSVTGYDLHGTQPNFIGTLKIAAQTPGRQPVSSDFLGVYDATQHPYTDPNSLASKIPGVNKVAAELRDQNMARFDETANYLYLGHDGNLYLGDSEGKNGARRVGTWQAPGGTPAWNGPVQYRLADGISVEAHNIKWLEQEMADNYPRIVLHQNFPTIPADQLPQLYTFQPFSK